MWEVSEQNHQHWAEALQVPQLINFLQLQAHWPLNSIKIQRMRVLWPHSLFAELVRARLTYLKFHQIDSGNGWRTPTLSSSFLLFLCPFKYQMGVLALKRLLLCQKPLSELNQNFPSNCFLTQGGQPSLYFCLPHLTLENSHLLQFHCLAQLCGSSLLFWVIPQLAFQMIYQD